jgi:hypothetical protein
MNLFNMLLTTTKKEMPQKPLTFTAEEAGATVSLKKNRYQQ